MVALVSHQLLLLWSVGMNNPEFGNSPTNVSTDISINLKVTNENHDHSHHLGMGSDVIFIMFLFVPFFPPLVDDPQYFSSNYIT